MGKQVILNDAVLAWKYLNGIFSVYKYADVSVQQVKSSLVTNICRTLNELKQRPVSKYVAIEGPPDDLAVIVRPNYADHPLVVGPRYQPQDVKLTWASMLGKRTSGVLVMGVNDGAKMANAFHDSKPLRTYRVKGRLGQAADNMFIDGKVLEKAKFEHVRRHHLEKVLGIFQAAHQKQMFLQSGVDIQSQTAYELAVKGLLRPSNSKVPIVYSFKCIQFEPPDFTIELMSINENEDYIIGIVHDIGIRLRTLAVCSGIQCVRHGCFTTEHSLLRRHWNIEQILNSIRQHERVMEESNFTLHHQPFLVEPALR